MTETTTFEPGPVRRPAGGRIALTVIGAVLVLVALVLGAIGSVLVWAHATQRDADGFYSSGGERLETVSYAITSEHIDLGVRPGGRERRFDLGDLATVRLAIDPQGEGPVFIGIGPADDVEGYLQGVAHAEIDDIDQDPFRVTYRYVEGDAPAGPPGEEGFWAASAEGAGNQTLEWELESGDWAVVAMNADGTAGVALDASVGVKADWVAPVGIGLLVAAVLLATLGAVLLVVGASGLHPTAGPVTAPEPVRLEGRLDEPLNRWLWLVKWLLLIPHLIALVLLWVAFVVLTAVAGVAILFTGRYPRSPFDFNVGVLRWSWRVTFYSLGAFATDRYPPFTLGPAPDYPATLDIAYPEQLSRGLVLVKWWLLAIPHYVVLGIISGAMFGGWSDDGATGGPGLIWVLSVIAAVILLFTSRYPRGIFDLVMGLDRWVYRVIPYAALMTDRYPPFRLDQGGSERVPVPPSATGTTASTPPSAPH